MDKTINLKGRSFLTLLDYSKDEILYLINLSKQLKNKKKNKDYDKSLSGKLLDNKNLVLIFDKTSTRTRCSFEVAANDEGCGVTFLTNSQMGKKESIEDTAKVLGRLYDGIQYRGYSMDLVKDISKYSEVPVFNGLTDDDHPTQVLADFLTAQEHNGKSFEEMKFAYVGDGRNNVANALMIGAAKVGMNFAVATPIELMPDQKLMEKIYNAAKISGAKIEILNDPKLAVKDADVIYTDIWVSMGEEDKMEERIKLLKPYQVDMALLEASGNPNVLFEHCLPSFHDLETAVGQMVYETYGLKEMEVTDEVFRSKNSIVFDEAENRMHTIKAVIVATMSDKL